VGWAESFQVQTAAAERIRRVALLRAGTATHAWNGDQRFVGCTFERTGDGLLVKAPPTRAIAPPGSYLLVVIDELGIPSDGRFLSLGPPRRGSSSLVQTGSGTHGDFALVAPRAGGGLSTWFRDNDAPGQPWSAGPPVAQDGGAIGAVPSTVQGDVDGALEVAARIGDRLASYRCAGAWDGPVLFGAPGVRGNPAMVRGRYGGRGNLELVVPVEGGGIAHYWRDDDSGGGWSEPTVFGESDGVVDAVALVQGDLGGSGDLEVIARYGTALAQWWRESAPPWRWTGPIYFFDGAAGVPSVVRSRFNVRGTLELVTPLTVGGAAHLSRDEDAAHLPWSDPSGDIAPGQRFVAASLLESSLGDSGRGGTLELVLRAEDGRNHHHWRTDGPPWSWQGPTAVLT
jgi:hypothetical protein